ncbi:hypothetical protein CO230_05350 [Chryseobacterium sp. 6424]|uniref:restriction endonuclease subunit S n=1 Tax=Chryseobacterium sp. 6424 TaxID=2039166 RepID=UPI000EFA3B38|nr:restriction endonuclease subunit S [Chryseobacterium sp. 6424]AYO57597.1 hypothetical protein CO230_05350 [Chryseobacterium sp. 6424]
MNNWKQKTLNDVCDKISLNKIKIKQKEYLFEGKYPVIDQGQELIGGYFDNQDLLVPNEPPYIVFGDHTKVKKFIPFRFIAGADGVKVLKAKSNILPKFLYYLLHTIKIENKGYARHFQLLEKETFLIPEDIPEQRAIVKKLESLFSSLDAGVADLKKAQQQLKIYRQAVLKKAFEGEVKKKGKDNFIETKINDISANLSNDMKIVKLGSLITLQGGYAFKSQEFQNEGIPVVKIANVNLDNINWDDTSYIDEGRVNEFKSYALKEGDVLIAMTRPVIKSLNSVKTVIVRKADLPCFLNQRVGRFLIKNGSVLKEYLQYFIKSTFFKDPIVRQANDSLLPNISGKIIESFDFLIPDSIDQQKQIVKQIESRLSVCDSIEQNIKESLEKAEALRQSILKKAFEGNLLTAQELAACKLAHDYEPANVLLERIKVEQNKTTAKPNKKTPH